MSFISVSRIGRLLGLSNHQIQNILTNNGYFDIATKSPTERAYENKLVRARTAVSKYSCNSTEFYLWDFDKIENLLRNTQKQENLIRFRSSEDAYNKILWAFNDFGEILQIDAKDSNNKISEEAKYSIVQARYGEANHLQGLVLVHRHFHPHEAEKARATTMKLANELFESAKLIDDSKANTNIFVIEQALSWLCESAK